MTEKANINLLAQAWADVLTRQTGIKHTVVECKPVVSGKDKKKGA